MKNEMNMAQKQIKVDVTVNKEDCCVSRYTKAPINTNFCQSYGHGANSPKGTTKPEKNRGE